MLTPSSQGKEVHENYSTSNPPAGKTKAVIAVIAVMRGILRMVTPTNTVTSTVSKE
jgi:hypothetical protein